MPPKQREGKPACVFADDDRRIGSHAFPRAPLGEGTGGFGHRGGARPRSGPAGPSGLHRRRGDREATPQREAAQCPGQDSHCRRGGYRPGGFSAPHRHPASGFVFAYVLSGTIRSQVEGEPLRVYNAGQSWIEPPNAHHLVSANASKTKPARLIAYIIADDGAEATVYDK